MTSAPLPPPEPPWEALEALAAGDLPPAEGHALRARLETEPAWRDAYANVWAVETLLREEALAPVPLRTLQRVLDAALPSRPARPLPTLGRVAAAVLVFCAAWWALAGAVPAMADVTPHPDVASALLLPEPPAPTDLLPAALAPSYGHGPWAWLVGGALLLAAGLSLAWRWHRHPPMPLEANR